MTPNVKMEHNIGDQRIKVFNKLISLHSDFRKYYIYRNGLYMVKLKYIPFWYKVRLFSLNIIRSFIGIALSQNKNDTIKLTFKGWKDGFKNNPKSNIPYINE